jgi:hypothetical protein
MHRIVPWMADRLSIQYLTPAVALLLLVISGCAPSAAVQSNPTPQIAQTILAAVHATQTAVISRSSLAPASAPSLTPTGNALPDGGQTATGLPAAATLTATSDPCAAGACETPYPTSVETPLPGLTLMPTDPAQKIPLAEIRISHPGQLSKVTSPISLESSVIPGADNAVHVELIGEDGSVLDRQVLGYATPHGQRVGINPKIEFEIPGVSEIARLQVYVMDAKKRVTALSSLELILLSQGSAEINPTPDEYSPYVVLQPQTNQQVSGGVIAISGLVRPVNVQPLIIDLVADSGEVIGSRQVQASAGAQGGHVAFQTSLPYTARQATWAQLVLHQPDTRIQGDAAIFSMPIYVNP